IDARRGRSRRRRTRHRDIDDAPVTSEKLRPRPPLPPGHDTVRQFDRSDAVARELDRVRTDTHLRYIDLRLHLRRAQPWRGRGDAPDIGREPSQSIDVWSDGFHDHRRGLAGQHLVYTLAEESLDGEPE